VNDEEYQAINRKYPIIATIPNGDMWDIQVVADKFDEYKAENMPPNLEHAYVYFMERSLNLWMND
jgi:hypothetical protein